MRGFTIAIVVSGCAGSSAADHPDAAIADTSTNSDATISPDASSFPVTLDGNRDRLLQTYLARLQSIPDTVQSNGLVGHALATVCDLWTALDPSSRDVFLTITHRLDGAKLADATRALDHVTRLYRVIGGQGATTTSAGSCGGGEYNRMILASDKPLHDAQLAASTRKGAAPYDLADITTSWRDSHDLAGPHTPFDLSDESNAGAPRGQTQYFRDPTSTAANHALGRIDVATVVDPYALEIDQDYDCTHNSNPACSYTFYGAACAPQATQPGTTIYTQAYGDFEPGWKPTGC